MFIAALYVLFVINCLFLILVVLLQAGKGDGLAALGGGGSGGGGDTILGNRGAATFLSKLTVVSAVLFMVLSIVLAYDASKTETRVGRGLVDPNLELSENAGLLALDEDEEGLTVEETEVVEPESSDEENAEEPAAVDTETDTSASTEEGEAASSPEDTPESETPAGGSE
jgi:preprotein translocase subunit SecG